MAENIPVFPALRITTPHGPGKAFKFTSPRQTPDGRTGDISLSILGLPVDFHGRVVSFPLLQENRNSTLAQTTALNYYGNPVTHEMMMGRGANTQDTQNRTQEYAQTGEYCSGANDLCLRNFFVRAGRLELHFCVTSYRVRTPSGPAVHQKIEVILTGSEVIARCQLVNEASRETGIRSTPTRRRMKWSVTAGLVDELRPILMSGILASGVAHCTVHLLLRQMQLEGKHQGRELDGELCGADAEDAEQVCDGDADTRKDAGDGWNTFAQLLACELEAEFRGADTEDKDEELEPATNVEPLNEPHRPHQQWSGCVHCPSGT
ncbi:hypothetical protein FB451DRAFT_1164935 [Mycena latifolia]|nr:hypothetical protein FB451DRAFT_1164935 [Mycena latifolia]